MNAASADRSWNQSGAYVLYVILLLSIVNVFNYMDRMALSVLLPSIKKDLELSDGQLGLLIGFAFSFFYAICGIPIARWADRGVRRNIIATALAVWSVMTALSGAAQNFWHLFLARVGVGAGEAGCIAPGQSIICDYVPLRRRSGAFAIHAFGLVAGMMLGMVLAGWLGAVIGWRWTLVALGLPGIGLAVIVRITLREPVRGSYDAVKEEVPSMSFRATVAYLWRCETYRLLMFFMVVNGFVEYGFYQWWPSLYTRVFGLGLSSVGVSVGTAIGVGSGIGLLIGGLMSDKAAQRDARLPLIICAGATLLSMPAAMASLFVSSASDSLMLAALTGLFWSVSGGPVVAALYSVVTSRMRATAGAITIFFTSVLGFGLGPFCVGLVSDILAPSLGAESLRYALLVPACLVPVAVIALCASARKLPYDLKAASAARDLAECQI